MSFWYLGSPYSKYAGGLAEAFIEAARNQALLLKAGVPVFCPIVHSHPAAIHGDIDPQAHDFWMAADAPFMALASGLIVLMLPGWRQSIGLGIEIATFMRARKPVRYMIPGQLPDPLPG